MSEYKQFDPSKIRQYVPSMTIPESAIRNVFVTTPVLILEGVGVEAVEGVD